MKSQIYDDRSWENGIEFGRGECIPLACIPPLKTGFSACVKLPDQLSRLLREVPDLGRSFLVGGCVRDALLGISNKDFDVEVYGVSYDQLEAALQPFGRVDLVGKAFGVIKFKAENGDLWDFSIPRRDSKIDVGHTGFFVKFDSEISPKEAASRRDFTINALMFDPRTGEYLDFYNGREDLKHRVLRHTSDAFVEDPLRVLRGMQFASRLEFEMAPETVELCRSIVDTYQELPVERVGEEWFKWASKCRKPSIGLEMLKSTGWIKHYPEIEALDGTPQDPEWHPEGDVFTHTCHCCDAMATLPEWLEADEHDRIVLMLAILAHDFAKPQTTHEAEKNGQMRIVSPGHEEQGGPLAETFLKRIHTSKALAEKVVPLVKNHLAHLQTITDRGVRRLANRLAPANIEELTLVMIADQFGRPPKPRDVHAGVVELREKAAELELQDQGPKPILLGRHLIEHGLKPGTQFGVILGEAFEAQLEGAFGDIEGAEQWLAKRLPE